MFDKAKFAEALAVLLGSLRAALSWAPGVDDFGWLLIEAAQIAIGKKPFLSEFTNMYLKLASAERDAYMLGIEAAAAGGDPDFKYLTFYDVVEWKVFLAAYGYAIGRPLIGFDVVPMQGDYVPRTDYSRPVPQLPRRKLFSVYKEVHRRGLRVKGGYDSYRRYRDAYYALPETRKLYHISRIELRDWWTPPEFIWEPDSLELDGKGLILSGVAEQLHEMWESNQ